MFIEKQLSFESHSFRSEMSFARLIAPQVETHIQLPTELEALLTCFYEHSTPAELTALTKVCATVVGVHLRLSALAAQSY